MIFFPLFPHNNHFVHFNLFHAPPKPLKLWIVHFRLLRSSIVLSCFNQSWRGHVLTRRALWNQCLWVRCQNPQKLHTLPSRDQWILLVEITEVPITLESQVSLGDNDESISSLSLCYPAMCCCVLVHVVSNVILKLLCFAVIFTGGLGLIGSFR